MKDAPYLHTIVEIEEFTRRAEKLLTAEERGALFDYLSQNPKAGTVIQGTGGVRKLRWAIRNKGKSGGVRVIYYYHNNPVCKFLGSHDKIGLT